MQGRPQKKYQKMLKTYVIALLVLSSFLAGLFVGRGNVAESTTVQSDGETKVVGKYSDKTKEIDFGHFWEVWDKIDSKYVLKPVDYEKLYHGAIKGMVEALDDPYSAYMDPEQTQQFQEQISGEFGGVGAELTLEEKQLRVVSVLPGTPAEAAGLRAEDYIIKINEEEAFGMSLFDAVSRIRGERGTVVSLEIYREGEESAQTIEITRDIINVPSVESEIKTDPDGRKVLYVKITSFSDDTFDEFEKAIDVNEAQNPEALVLDLRGNSGGLLEQSVNVAGELMDAGEVVAIEEFSDGARKEFKAAGQERLKELPMIVLVNKGSASASEILAGALRDNRGVQLYGEQTFGKGTVQEYTSIGKNASLRISVAKWLTPNGTDINKEGLSVDVEVERSIEDIENERDPQLDAVLNDIL